mgnify:CR=1 FL=1
MGYLGFRGVYTEYYRSVGGPDMIGWSGMTITEQRRGWVIWVLGVCTRSIDYRSVDGMRWSVMTITERGWVIWGLGVYTRIIDYRSVDGMRWSVMTIIE